MILPSREEIQKIWGHFPVGLNDFISIRALCPKGVEYFLYTQNVTFNAIDFPDVEERKRAFEDKVMKLNVEGYNVYFVMNLISPEFRGNLRNTAAVSDTDIIARRYLLIDIDRDDTTQPASMEELTEVVGVARDIQRHLREEFGYKPIRVFSGNGCHLYLPLANLPNTEETREHCHSILLRLARKFNTGSVNVDTSVANASRITKLPGTVARKGLESEGRAYQLARVL
jgi:DNA primase